MKFFEGAKPYVDEAQGDPAVALERAGVPESQAVQILGHERMSLSYSVYSLGLNLEGLRRVVERISYPKVKLPA